MLVESKTSSGFANENDYNIYINETLIKNFNCDNYEQYIPFLRDTQNKIFIEHLNLTNYNYFIQMLFYFDTPDKINLFNTIDKWKQQYLIESGN